MSYRIIDSERLYHAPLEVRGFYAFETVSWKKKNIAPQTVSTSDVSYSLIKSKMKRRMRDSGKGQDKRGVL